MFFDKRIRSSMSRTAMSNSEIQNVLLACETKKKKNRNDKG